MEKMRYGEEYCIEVGWSTKVKKKDYRFYNQSDSKTVDLIVE